MTARKQQTRILESNATKIARKAGLFHSGSEQGGKTKTKGRRNTDIRLRVGRRSAPRVSTSAELSVRGDLIVSAYPYRTVSFLVSSHLCIPQPRHRTRICAYNFEITLFSHQDMRQSFLFPPFAVPFAVNSWTRADASAKHVIFAADMHGRRARERFRFVFRCAYVCNVLVT